MANYVLNDFYCIKCGQKNFSIPRKDGKMHEKFHRKRLYCYHCKEEINCVECKNEEEVRIFKEQFERGGFKDEAEESLAYSRNARLGQKLVRQK
nr:MAG TPA: RNA-binding protein [Caudoviricetes sp.]